MDDAALGRTLFVLRRRQRLTQEALGARSGVSQGAISLIERGHVDGASLGRLRRVFAAAGSSLVVEVRWRGGELDRLRDERHATLVAAFAARARALGWAVEVEVTYSEYGERGSIDLLCLDPARRAIAVVEVKSELTSVEATLRKLDEKVRLAPKIVAGRYGWRPSAIGRILVLPDVSASRRRVDRHRRVFGAALPTRATELRQWLRAPGGSISGIWFLSVTNHVRERRASASPRPARRSGQARG